MKNKKIWFVILMISNVLWSQKDGFWDKERATSKEIIVKSGEKVLIKSNDLPIGTTEIVFRITLLNESQKLTSSLVSVLKAIPDPSGVSQGAAGVLHLGSVISGDDKCTYAVFQNTENANLYLKNEKYSTCYEQIEKVNKDAKLLNSNSLCLSNLPYLSFGFKNENWIMDQKIVLEIVPWVDEKASRGWTKTTKNEILELAKQSKVINFLKEKDGFIAEFIEILSQKFRYNDFKNLLQVEKINVVNAISDESLIKSRKLSEYLKNYSEFIEKKSETNIEDAINDLLELNEQRKLGKANEYDLLGTFYLKTKQFQKAESWCEKAIEKDKNQIIFQLHKAHIYMFTDRFSEAKEIHKKFKNQNIDSKTSWIDAAKIDFQDFEKLGLETDNFKKILRFLD